MTQVRPVAHLVSADVSPSTLRTTLACFPSGVTAVAALDEGRPLGMAASSFASVSLDPPLVLFCAAQTSLTWPRLRLVGHLGVSVLSEEHGPLCRQLAGPTEERFSGVAWTATEDGAVLVEGAAAWLYCHLDREVTAGDHTVAILHVDGVKAAHHIEPLVFHRSRFRGLT